jgi:hypothetical protein
MATVVRVSIIRCAPEHFDELKRMMAEAEATLAPGIRQLRGLVDFYVGEDAATSSLCNVSRWRTLADAHQLDTYQPMLDLGASFIAKGAKFERPIMNYSEQWEIEPQGGVHVAS